MSRVSRRWLDRDVEEKIHRLLVQCVTESKNQQIAGNFIDVLLTKTEKLMIGKRIAIALMLVKGDSPMEIDEKLKVSLTTVYTVKAWLEEKGAEYHELLLDIAHRDEAQEKTHHELQRDAEEPSIFPPRRGTNWKADKRRKWQKAEASKVPF